MANITKSNKSDSSKLAILWARALSTLTEEEIRKEWSDPTLIKAIDKIDPIGYEERLTKHNPIYFLAQKCWFDNDSSLLYEPLHRDRICKSLLKHYMDDSDDFASLLLLVQRDSYKTSFTHGVFPHFVSLREKDKFQRDVRLALIHHKENQASANLQKLKLKCQHPWVKEVWPEFSVTEDFDTKLGFDWPCKIQGIIPEKSVMAAGLGARLTGFHFDWMIFDDIVTEEHIDSKVVRDEAFSKYQASRFMLDTHRGKELCSGTRYHPNDLWGKLQKAKIDENYLYRLIHIQAGGYKDTKEELVELSFPTRHTIKFLDKKRAEFRARSGNDDLWWLQYQNVPRAARMVATDPNWLQSIKEDEIPYGAWGVITIDPAWKATKNAGEGCSSSIQVWRLERRGSLILYYMIDGVHSNELTGEQGKNEIFRLMKRHGINDVAPEEIGGHGFRQGLRNDAISRGVFINVIDLKSRNVNKDQRIVNFLGKCERRQVYICDSVPEDLKSAFMDEYIEYPQVDYKDALDAAAYVCDPAIEEAYAPRFNTWSEPHQNQTFQRRTRYCMN